MSREELFEQVKNKYLELAQEVNNFKKDNKKELKTYKNGVYTFWDKDDKLLYVGMISNRKYTDLYKRLYGHAGGSHFKTKFWFNNITKVKFYHLSNGSKQQVRVLERILIDTLFPIYNDLFFEDNEIQEIINLMV